MRAGNSHPDPAKPISNPDTKALGWADLGKIGADPEVYGLSQPDTANEREGWRGRESCRGEGGGECNHHRQSGVRSEQ